MFEVVYRKPDTGKVVVETFPKLPQAIAIFACMADMNQSAVGSVYDAVEAFGNYTVYTSFRPHKPVSIYRVG